MLPDEVSVMTVIIGDLVIDDILFNSLAQFKYFFKFLNNRYIKNIIKIIKKGIIAAIIISC